MASVPLRTPRSEPFGALTIVTATAGEPTAGQRKALRAVAGWAAGRLRQAEQPRVLPETPQSGPDATGGTGLGEAFAATHVGAWIWYLATGLLDGDEPSLALLGIDPDAFDGRIETWLSVVHPDDISWLAAEVDKAVSTFGPYDAEYRICRPDGTTRWIQSRGGWKPTRTGTPTGCWARPGTPRSRASSARASGAPCAT